MYHFSSAFGSALRSSHTPVFRVDAYLGAQVVASDLPVASGSVSVDATSSTRRQLSVQFADASRTLYSTLARVGTELRVQRGVRFGDGTVELVPVGVFQVTAPTLQPGTSSAGVSVSAPDRWNTVARARFPAPRAWDRSWPSLAAAVEALTVEPWQARHALNPHTAVPGFLDLMVGAGAPQKALVWARDRGQAVIDLATDLGGEVFFNADGNGVLRPVPVQTAPVWDADQSTTGVLVTAQLAQSLESSYNTVVVTGVDSSGNTTVTATAQVTNPAHPLWVGGAFGVVPYFYASTSVQSYAQALQVAQTLLDTAAAVGSQITGTCVPNPALAEGDTVRVTLLDGTVEDHVLVGFTVPLTVTDTQTLTLQSTRPSGDLPTETS